MIPSKTCPRCETHKPAAAFNKNKRRKDGLQTYCRDCQRNYDRENYAKNPERKRQIAEKRTRNTDQRRAIAQQLVADYLKSHPCMDCGEDDIIVLQFDHVRGKKDMPISVMVTKGYSEKRITNEIAKCEVRCGNCHKRRTAREGTFRSITMLESMQNNE